MKKIPIFGSGVRSYSDIVTRQRRVNCFYDLRPDGDRETQLVVVGTPGQTTVATTPDTAAIFCMRAVGIRLFVATLSHFYVYTPGYTIIFTGTWITGTTLAVTMADQGTQVYVMRTYKSGITIGYEAYVYDINSVTLVPVADANFGYSGVTGLSSRFVGLPYPGTGSARQFNVSNLLSGTSWTPLVFGTKEQYGDPLVTTASVKGALLLLGSGSTEFWQDVGSYPNPFQRINGTTTKWGIASAASLAYVKDTVMYLATDPDGKYRVAMINGYTVQPVSTSDIDSIIANFTSPTNCTALVYTALGHPMYQITWPADNRTLTYDVVSQIWHEAQTGGGTTPQAHSAVYCVTYQGDNLTATGLTGGVISKFDMSTKTDNGTAIYREVCTKHIRDQGNQTFLCQAWLDFELGTSSGNVTLNVSKDGGNSFGPSKVKSVSSRGQRVIWNRLGSSEDFVLKISTSDPINFTILGGSASVDLSDD